MLHSIAKLFSWLRFIDDIDMKWTHGRDTLEAFLKTANSFHPTIRFTAEVSNDKHVFLDMMSQLADDKVAVDLYTKPADSHQYLLPTSCHPPHCRIYHIVLHYASDASARMMRLLRIDQRISLNISNKGVIKSRQLTKP